MLPHYTIRQLRPQEEGDSPVRGLLVLQLDLHLTVSKTSLFRTPISKQVLGKHLTPETFAEPELQQAQGLQ